MFASAGIGETYFSEAGIDIVVANELLDARANLYKAINPSTTVICGDISVLKSLGWRKKYSLSEGLKEEIEIIKEKI